jgi:hypothetical protein
MKDKDSIPHIAALQELEAALDAHRRNQAGACGPAGAPKQILGKRILRQRILG